MADAVYESEIYVKILLLYVALSEVGKVPGVCCFGVGKEQILPSDAQCPTPLRLSTDTACACFCGGDADRQRLCGDAVVVGRCCGGGEILWW